MEEPQSSQKNTSEAARSWWSRGKVELKLKVMFREQNKRKTRKDGMEGSTERWCSRKSGRDSE